jgi:hypothetical protein
VERQPVESSVIRAAGYDPVGAVLELEFRDGDLYRYFDFPEFLYRGLMLSASKGEFFSRRISGRYAFEQVPRHGDT